jgi:hypothetical protein
MLQEFNLTLADMKPQINAAFRSAIAWDNFDICLFLAPMLDYRDVTSDDNCAFRLAVEDSRLHLCQWLALSFKLTREDAMAQNNFTMKEATEKGVQEVCRWLSSYFSIPLL